MRLLFAWLALLAAFTSVQATAAGLPPRPNGPVYDGANVIGPSEKQLLERRLSDYNRTTGRAIIVATVPSLDGQDIEAYAQQLAESWDIGGKESENGLLFLVAPNEHKMRIATARGLQERMTDIMSGRIIREITPKFKQGDLSGGITDGVDAIIVQLDMDPAQAKAIEEAERTRQRNEHENAAPAIAGVIFWIVMIVFFIGVFGSRARGRRYRGGGMGGAVGNVLMWTALNAAMNSGRSGGNSWGGSSGGGFGGFGGGGGGGGGFGGFGGGGGGFNGGGASGGW